MPIKGLTVRPAFPTLGKLRKGGPKTQANRPGPDLEYFRFTSDDPQIEAAFYAAYPPEPKSINVFLPNKSVDDNWACWQEHWVAGGLMHRCDGETCVVWQTESGEYRAVDDLAGLEVLPLCPGGCAPVGRLQVILPELLQAGYVGYVTVETHSKHDIMSIQACLEDAARKGNGYGLTGIEFRLYRVEQKISTPMINKQTGVVKRVRRAKWLVKLAPTARWVQAQLAQAEHLQLAMPEALALPEPLVDIIEDGEFTEEAPVVEATPEGLLPKYEGRQPHWVDDEAQSGNFWRAAGAMGYDEDEVLLVLEVEHLPEYAGTAGEALTTLHNNRKGANAL